MIPKFREIRNTDSEIIWATEAWNESDWPISFLLVLQYTEYWSEEWARESGNYCVGIYAVSPEAAKDKIDQALTEYGMSGEEWDMLQFEHQCDLLRDHGIAARLYEKVGNNKDKMIKEARKEFKMILMMFGLFMDRQINAIGDSGWEAIKGRVGERIYHGEYHDA